MIGMKSGVVDVAFLSDREDDVANAELSRPCFSIAFACD